MNIMFAAFLGGWEWIVVMLAVLLLFGAKKIPELAKGLGQGIKEFKKATREVTDEIQNTTTDTPPPAKPAAPAPVAGRPAGFAILQSAQSLRRDISGMAGDHEAERPDEAEGGPVKTFLEHLEDFRWVLIKSIVALFLAMLVCLFAGQLRHPDHQVAADARPPSVIPARTRLSPSVSAPTTSAIFSSRAEQQNLEPRHKPFCRRPGAPLTVGTNQVLGWQVSDDPGAVADAQRMKVDLVNLSPAGGFVVAFQVAIYGGAGAGLAVYFLLHRGVCFPGAENPRTKIHLSRVGGRDRAVSRRAWRFAISS